jgi:hypothetical protein
MTGLSAQLLLGISGADVTKIILIAIFALGIVLVVLVPFVIDIVNAHASWRTIVTAHPETLDKLPGPNGIQGLARATMALALIVAISFGLGYVMVEHPFLNSNTIVSNILVALTTALASITAFYFGSRSANEAHAAARDAVTTGQAAVTAAADAAQAAAAQAAGPAVTGVRATAAASAAAAVADEAPADEAPADGAPADGAPSL